MNEGDLRASLRRLDPGAPRADLAERAFRRAMAEGRAPTFAERFVGVGRRLVLGAAAVAAAVWLGLYLRADDAAPPAAATASISPIEPVLTAWAGEEPLP